MAVASAVAMAQSPTPNIELGVAQMEWPPSVRATDRFDRASTSTPIRVRLLSLPSKEYKRLERVPFEISVQNVSKEPLVIPWSPVQGVADHPPEGFRHVTFDFILTRRGAPDWRIARAQLSGSQRPYQRDGLKTLLPGERVVIRAPIALVDGEQKELEDPVVHAGKGEIRVGVRFDAPEDPLTTSFGARYAENDVRFEVLPTLPALPPPLPIRQPPVVTRVLPTLVSQGTTIRIDGYRLGADRFVSGNDQPLARYFFSNGTTRVATVRGGTSNMSAGDPNAVTQFVTLAVPNEIQPGTWTVIVALDGLEGAAASPVTVAEWDTPQVQRLSPERVNPGDVVTIAGNNFHRGDTANGFDPQHKFDLLQPLNQSSTVRAFVVPADAAEGEHTVRVNTFKRGERVGRQSPALKYIVQHAPLRPTIRNQTARAVGVGQWLALEGARGSAWTDRTEVEFVQGEHREIADAEIPTDPVPIPAILATRAVFVRIPKTLAPGAVSVRARLWHQDTASDWSEPAIYDIAFNPVPPDIQALFVGPTRQRVLLMGPAPANRFEAMAGDTISLTGSWPTHPAAEIPLVLAHQRHSVHVTSKWTNQTALHFSIPEHLSGGPWTITISAVDETPSLTLPIVVYVHER